MRQLHARLYTNAERKSVASSRHHLASPSTECQPFTPALIPNGIASPALIYNEPAVRKSLSVLSKLTQDAGCRALFAMKSLCVPDLLVEMVSSIEGFATSSLFEAKLARQTIGRHGTVHLTTPGLRVEELSQLGDLCDYVAFNSWSQLERFGDRLPSRTSVGLRVNPQLSLVDDPRYDPCRPNSKLGAPASQLLEKAPELRGVKGILFHTNCESTDFRPLVATLARLDPLLERLAPQLEWVNMGGGYLFLDSEMNEIFCEAVHQLRSRYGVEVFVEPGRGVVGDAGWLVSTVLDMFVSDGKHVAVLDTTVNHFPEVFEYQFEPDVVGHVENARFSYVLAGCSCLAGDVFGEYSFEDPLEVGSRVTFLNALGYTLVKANMFNGINLPTIYALTEQNRLVEKRHFTYEDFVSRMGGPTNAAV